MIKNDCVYLFEILERFIDEYGLNLTLAGSAFKYWVENHTETKQPPKSTKDYFKENSKFYYGGRVECFYKGVIEETFKSFHF
mgnify:CR=1 FL=1